MVSPVSSTTRPVPPVPRRLLRCRWTGALGVLAATLASCAGGGDERVPAPTPIAACTARVGDLRADATLVRGAGRYHLTMVAAGNGGERSVTGALELVNNEPPLRRLLSEEGQDPDGIVLLPLYGWAAIDLTAIDALEIGDTGSRDPLQPGVLVVEQRPAPTADVAITLRFGSLANRRDAAGAADGAYMALHVAHVAQSGSFAGTWASGVYARRVSGHFCATRLPEEPQDSH